MLKATCTFIFLVVFFAVGNARNTIIVNNKTSNYQIVVSPAATDIQKRSASILQQYISQISSCNLPIASVEKTSSAYQIIIGNTAKLAKTDTSGLGQDGILIKQVNNTIIITGGYRKGILYATYTFLEDYLGCCAYTAEDIYIPKSNSIEVKVKILKKQLPTFGYRMMHFPDAFSTTYCDWRKINYIYEDWGSWVHTFSWLVPASDYFKPHPQYFALINGKRDSAQICPSSSEAVTVVVNTLKSRIKAKPSAKYWSVSQNDNQQYCECELCKKINKEQESPTGALLNFVNKVAVYFPDKIISTLAYGYSEKPPKNIKPAANVMIMLTTATVNDRRLALQQNLSLKFHKNFKKWSAITGNLMIWDYLVKYANLWLPLPNMRVYQPNMRYFGSYRTRYVFMQGPGAIPSEFNELKGFIISKLMWNKDVDVNAETNKFLMAYYGTVGGKYMSEYLNLLSKEATDFKSSMLILQQDDSTMFTTYMSRSNTARYQKLFDTALLKVGETSAYGKRILKEYSSLLYAELESDRLNINKLKTLSTSEKNLYRQNVNTWKKVIEKTSVKYLSESGLTVDDYFQQYLRSIETIPTKNSY